MIKTPEVKLLTILAGTQLSDEIADLSDFTLVGVHSISVAHTGSCFFQTSLGQNTWQAYSQDGSTGFIIAPDIHITLRMATRFLRIASTTNEAADRLFALYLTRS